MRDGLAFVEDYLDDRTSDVIHMLFGGGTVRHGALRRRPPAGGAAGHSLQLLLGDLEHHLGNRGPHRSPGESYARFLHGRLFGPIGMKSADPEFDEAGTWVASSYVRATAQDFARFGLLYPARRDVGRGCASYRRAGVDYGRTWVSVDPDNDNPYGAHWYGVVGDTLGTFRASGLRGPVHHHPAPPST